MAFIDEQAEAALEVLEDLRDSKLATIKGNEAHIVSLQEVNGHLTTEAKALDEAIQQVKERYERNGFSHQGTPPLIGKYVKSKLSDAIMDVISRYGIQPGLSAPEIIVKLKEEGFTSKAKDLYPSVYSVAVSLMKRKKINESIKEGKRSFVRREPF